jgi:hypothetical protein
VVSVTPRPLFIRRKTCNDKKLYTFFIRYIYKFVFVAESGPTISLYSIDRLVFVIGMDVVFFEVGNEFLCIARWTSFFKMPYHGSRLRVRLHWSQNRHNTTNQHLSGYTLQERVATFKPTTVLSIATTVESYAHCSKYLARLSARNKLTLSAPDSLER